MAILGGFEKAISFIKKNANHPFIQFQLEKSNIEVSEIKTYEDFLKIRTISRKDLADLSKDSKSFFSLFESCPLKIFESPGGILNCLFDRYNQYRFYKALEISSFGPCDIIVNTFSYHLTPAGEMFEEASEKIGATVFPLGPTNSDKCAEIIRKIGATAFIGTKTFLKKVLEVLGKENPLLKAYLIAEKITESERKYLSENYKIEIYQGYGTAEVGLIATECEYKDGMHIDDEIFVELLSPDHQKHVSEDEIGEVVVTLLNSKYPLLRYSTGDLSKYTLQKCVCDREIPRLLGIFGRVDSSVKVKGVFIHQWEFDEFCLNLGLNGRLEVENKGGVDQLILKINKNVQNIYEIFKEKFKLSLKDVVINDEINKNEIVDNREYLKER
ncbi:phenylacetate-CoA ligase [Deferribacter desulfuricans SSM1]|uniref:Phenylacetate-CoA ligase n=1 Tax=Deferribacter desulfuricans (strain DSM 14783 / JCM 11476 / NBRC 101012 / SSM1) TaxID=639282 RepID=D3PEC8_DEFDS|nr:AMP-binding protein [Deferribacter desulfuricans]BAI80951.1 phenylacetate-CoA ligase [Deferribacter desulfuricans SSM1]